MCVNRQGTNYALAKHYWCIFRETMPGLGFIAICGMSSEKLPEKEDSDTFYYTQKTRNAYTTLNTRTLASRSS